MFCKNGQGLDECRFALSNCNVFEQGNLEAACSVFDAALQSEKTKEDSRALAILYIQYARFLDRVCYRYMVAVSQPIYYNDIISHCRMSWQHESRGARSI